MQAGEELRFDHFRLDPVNVRLWRGKQVIALTPKAFACALLLSGTRRTVSDERRAVDGRLAGDLCERGGALGVRARDSQSAWGYTTSAPVYPDRAPAGVSVHWERSQ